MPSHKKSKPSLGNFASQLHIDPPAMPPPPAPRIDAAKVVNGMPMKHPAMVDPKVAQAVFGHYADPPPKSPSLTEALDPYVNEKGINIGHGGRLMLSHDKLNPIEPPQPSLFPPDELQLPAPKKP
jgi:hypothetical protein